MNIDLKDYIADVADFPKAGIIFKDIAPLLGDPDALYQAISAMSRQWVGKIDAIAALDARGFVFGGMLAFSMRLPLVMVRKKGKLPGETYDESYDLEYGQATLSVQKGSFPSDADVLVVDDLLATGGTARAACSLIEKAGARIAGCAFVIELDGLGGRNVLSGREIQSLVNY